jgi:hypothetical protein
MRAREIIPRATTDYFKSLFDHHHVTISLDIFNQNPDAIKQAAKLMGFYLEVITDDGYMVFKKGRAKPEKTLDEPFDE